MNRIFGPQFRRLSLFRSLRFLLFPTLFFLAAAAQAPQTAPIANFTDIAEKAGLTMTTVFGGKNTK